jgi:hypothetical protein
MQNFQVKHKPSRGFVKGSKVKVWCSGQKWTLQSLFFPSDEM